MAFSERIARLKSSLIREILAAAQRSEVMSFAGGLPAEPMLPKVDWAEMPASMGQYGMSEGEPALRMALQGYLRRARGLVCSADQIVVVQGSQQAIDLLISQLKKTKNNYEFLLQVQSNAPGAMKDD